MRLAREGAAVSLISRRVPERLLKKVNRFEHGAVHTAGDVTKSDDVKRAIDDPAWDGADHSVADELLSPSVIYTPAVRAVIAAL